MCVMRTRALGCCLALFLCVASGCGGGSSPQSSSTPQNPPSPSPPPTPPAETPTIIWTGDPLVTTHAGDNGIDALFAPPGVRVIPDGSGGALLAWEDDWYGWVFVQRLDANGNRMWSDTGVRVAPDSPFQAGPALLSDGGGGMIAAFVDGRAGFCDYGFRGSCQIYAQRFDASGNALWQPNGIPINTAPGNQGNTGIAIASDRSGGAFLSWEDARSCCAIYAQHISSTGQTLWTTNGVAVSPPPTLAIGSIGVPPVIADDGNGGAIVAFWNIQVPNNQNPLISTQRLDPQGNLLWSTSGAPVSLHLINTNESDITLYFQMVADGSGGAIVAAVNNQINNPIPRLVRVQRIDQNGQNLWPENGVAVTAAAVDQTYPMLLADGAGGAFVTWRNCVPPQGEDCNIFAQRLSSTGQAAWGAQGVSISSAPGVKGAQQIVPDEKGGAFIFWNDCRNFTYPDQLFTCYVQMDLFGQRVNGQGETLWLKDGFPISTAPGNQGVPYTEDFTYPNYAISPDGQGGVLLAWPDGRDSPCSAANNAASRCELRAQHVRP